MPPFAFPPGNRRENHNAEVFHASLHLYSDNTGLGAPFNVYIGWVTGNWSESSLTWNNKPNGQYYSSTYWTVTSSAGWVNWACGNEVEGMLNAGYNEGLVIFPVATSGNHYKWFYSDETSQIPYLEITWRESRGPIRNLPGGYISTMQLGK
jgi:hypothetical protein